MTRKHQKERNQRKYGHRPKDVNKRPTVKGKNRREARVGRYYKQLGFKPERGEGGM